MILPPFFTKQKTSHLAKANFRGDSWRFFAGQLLRPQEYFVYCKGSKGGAAGKERLSTGKVFSEVAK